MGILAPQGDKRLKADVPQIESEPGQCAVATPLAGRALADAATPSWPSGIVKIIVPFPPGGSVDPIARMAQPGMQQKLGATIVIDGFQDLARTKQRFF